MAPQDSGNQEHYRRPASGEIEALRVLVDTALQVEAESHLAQAQHNAPPDKKPGRSGYRRRMLCVPDTAGATESIEVRVPRFRHAPGFKPQALSRVEQDSVRWLDKTRQALAAEEPDAEAVALLRELTGKEPEAESAERLGACWAKLAPSESVQDEDAEAQDSIAGPSGAKSAEEIAEHRDSPQDSTRRAAGSFRRIWKSVQSMRSRYVRAQFEGRGLRLPLGLLGTLAVGFAALGIAVLDMPIAKYFYGLRQEGSGLVWLFFGIERLGSSTYYLIISAALAAWAAWKGWEWFRKPLFVFLSIGLAGIAVNIIKYVAGRARPLAYFEDGLWGFYGFETEALLRSFPSGHAATAVALAGALAFLFPGAKRFWWSFGIVVAFARVITSEHYFADFVIGSFLGAASAVLLSRIIFTSAADESTPVRAVEPRSSPKN